MRRGLGLPGGYPVSLREGRIDVQFSPDCPQDEAVRINSICQSQDGIDEIHCDGSVTYNPQCMAVMQAMLGYSRKPWPSSSPPNLPMNWRASTGLSNIQPGR
jgi:hypothetical protein